jgi:hypothetical protein
MDPVSEHKNQEEGHEYKKTNKISSEIRKE